MASVGLTGWTNPSADHRIMEYPKLEVTHKDPPPGMQDEIPDTAFQGFLPKPFCSHCTHD